MDDGYQHWHLERDLDVVLVDTLNMFGNGVRRETIGKLENGKYNPSLKLAMDIARVFGKTVEDVFIFEDDDEDDME
ncbi:MAG: tetraacyldisaccharide 4'-kinase [Oscillospiraceae bacterium]|nr:tetraacyldisaccharide 4'-kinase [Oscillospiraceae bacterium]